ncbi:SDR family NAD(P)-dependent oxidoreductase [Planctomycetes bacterium K23_9]|uniref:3-oxoacyl-[acyl-carrier-protein] reductase FabG n=1 Tax=Stieleria marina TaxID=1930275 RepID=A0A517NYS2_9BACT|nr:3-oxoacyl-[acyl-carrier-protein] reductase FabG [Planctomycetes bacterium K23_9]
MNLLLTGGSRGLGLQIAEHQLSLGHQVYVVSRNVTKELDSLLRKFPERACFIDCDLADTGQIKKRVFDDQIGKETPLHGLISNAATAYDDLLTNLQPEPLHSMFQTNVYAPMFLTKYVVRNMLLHEVAGSIVHISSISAHTGYKGLAMYAATKGAIESFSKNTAREWGSKGIRSNCVVAGFMETEMSSSLSNEQRDRIHKRTALKRPTSLVSVASTVEYLLSDGSQSVTGQNLFVDSGTI